jgi:hypothetical protein
MVVAADRQTDQIEQRAAQLSSAYDYLSIGMRFFIKRLIVVYFFDPPSTPKNRVPG